MSWLSRTRIGMAGLGVRPRSLLFAQLDLRTAAGTAKCGRQTRAVRCIALKVLLYAGEDRIRELALVRCCRKLALVFAVRDEGGLDEHRRNVRRLQHDESRLLHTR